MLGQWDGDELGVLGQYNIMEEKTVSKPLGYKDSNELNMELLYKAYMAIPTPLLVIDEKMDIIFINPEGDKLLFNYRHGEAKGNVCKLFLSDVTFLLSDSMEEEEISYCKSFFVGESKRYFEVILKRLSTFNKRNYYLLLLHELSPSLNTSDDEREKELMEKVQYEKIKNEFFANISHEFRTPLNIIYSSLQVMDLYVMKNPLLSNMKKYLSVMKKNCFRLLRLTRNLMDITSMDVGFFEIHPCNLNIVSIVEDVTLSVVKYCKNKEIDLVFDTDVEEKVIACDEDVVERIMLNLISNALKFTPRKGTIEVNLKDKGKWISISVKDNGMGIEECKQKCIFERFRQVDKSFTRNTEGSGVGLSIVKQLVELHGGTITLNSKYGKGSEFIVELPARYLKEEEMDCSFERESFTEKNINIELSDLYE